MLNLNEKEIEKIRENSSMSQFCFYLDDITKLKCLQKLALIGYDGKKGTLASTIRVLLNMFADGKFNDQINYITEEIKKEARFTTKKNKRSSM
jgi:hypothetical protein